MCVCVWAEGEGWMRGGTCQNIFRIFQVKPFNCFWHLFSVQWNNNDKHFWQRSKCIPISPALMSYFWRIQEYLKVSLHQSVLHRCDCKINPFMTSQVGLSWFATHHSDTNLKNIVTTIMYKIFITCLNKFISYILIVWFFF